LIVQILMDQGFAAAGVTLDSAAPKGVHKLALTQLRSTFPVLSDPRNRHKVVELTFKQFHYAFANTMSEEDARKAYERYAIPDTGKPLFQSAFSDLISHATTSINYKNNIRSPLLLLAGSEDHTVPATVSRANYKKYNQSSAKTDFHEFPGRSHLIMVQEGWQEVVDYIHTWLNKTLGD
jgi:alpha-beta hydrolase superfamily lysophospholipase